MTPFTALRELIQRLWGTLRRVRTDSDIKTELQSHLELAEREFLQRGIAPKEASRLARVRFGGVAPAMEAQRDQRGFPALDTLWLDVKLGLRMLQRSWGLTLVGGLAMAIAIAIATFAFYFSEVFFSPSLPLDEGNRVVAIQTWDERAQRRHDTSLEDLRRWQVSLESVTDFGAFRSTKRRLSVTGRTPESVVVSEITASGFELARVDPQLGRVLEPGDESPSSPRVVVIGHDAWQTRFGGASDIIGTSILLNDEGHTVVGVMPHGFKFPVNHKFWTALQPGTRETLGDAGPEGAVFARLREGHGLQSLRTELETLGLLAEQSADQALVPTAVPYTFAFTGDFRQVQVKWVIRIVLMLVTMLLIPPCANVAILVYARTVTRQEEFAARYALGASRTRIVGQIFVEILVLALLAAGVALLLVRAGVWRVRDLIVSELPEGLPFWMDFSLTARTVLFASALAVLAALIAGAIPALQATGNRLQSGLRALGSRTGMKLGATWTTLVVAQVALSLAALPAATEMAWGTLRSGILGPGFDARPFLTARLSLDEALSAESPGEGKDIDPPDALVRVLLKESGVSGVTLSDAPPGEESWAQVEIEGVAYEESGIFTADTLVRRNFVDAAFLDTYDVEVLTGRRFHAGDFVEGSQPVIIDRSFAELLIPDGSPLGRRLRYAQSGGEADATPEPYRYQIVGVVADLPANTSHGKIYHPRPLSARYPVSLSLRAQYEDASTLAPRIQEILAKRVPDLEVAEMLTLHEIYRENQVGNNLGALLLATVTISVLLLSAAGMYALTSFTVNQKRREIGIRTALGARPDQVVTGIFAKVLRQLGGGALLGILLATAVDTVMPIEEAGGANIPGAIFAAASFMAVVGLLAASGPARRGLRVEPIEELREG